MSERRYANCCQDKTLIEEGTKETRRWRPRCQKSLLFYARHLGQSTWRAQKAYGKEIEGKCLVLDCTRAMLQAKVTNRQHARTSRLRAATSPFHFGWPESVHMTDNSIRYDVHSHPKFTSVHIQIARYTMEGHHSSQTVCTAVVRVIVLMTMIVLVRLVGRETCWLRDRLSGTVFRIVQHRTVARRAFLSSVAPSICQRCVVTVETCHGIN